MSAAQSGGSVLPGEDLAPLVVRSTTGTTHIRVPRSGENPYEQTTVCGVSSLGWGWLYELRGDDLERNEVTCLRCVVAWEKR